MEGVKYRYLVYLQHGGGGGVYVSIWNMNDQKLF